MGKVTDIDSPQRKQPRKRRTPAKIDESKPSREHWAKATQAYELLLGGKSYTEIAEQLDISRESGVWQMLLERFSYDAAKLTEAERKDMLGLELLRLNALLAAVWPSAMMGDPKSVDSAVKIVATQAKISGLEQVDPVVNKNLVLVMGEKEEDYINALRRAEGSE